MIKKGGWRMADGGIRFRRSLCAQTFPLPSSPLRPGFTLIELLVAISIIATLSALFLGASRAAMESSRASRTRATIDKLHTLVMERYADYETRRVALNQQAEAEINSFGSTTPEQQRATAAARHDYQLLALRELMRLEMPDRWSNFTGVITGSNMPADPSAILMVLRELPTLSRIYQRRYDPIRTTERFEGAECLYMIVMYGCGEGESRTMFSAQDIGDVDEDGAPEFLDGWGQPINFVRWPAGFVSASSYMSGDAENDHDPFDFARRDMRRDTGNPSSQLSHIQFLNDHQGAFRLMPLIFSNGPDAESGVLTPDKDGVDMMPYQADPYRFARLDPYAIAFREGSSSDQFPLAAVGGINGRGSDHIDNIHNHLDNSR